MLNGAKTAKRRGQIQRLNAELNRPGLISHHINIAIRGPKSIRIVVMQHILFLPFQIFIGFKVFSYLTMAKITITIKNTIKMINRIFRIPQPVAPAPLKPNIPEKIISTTAMIAKIQKMLMLYSFSVAMYKINTDYFKYGKDDNYC